MLLTAGRLIKYDLKELFKKHIALYIVTLLAAFGCWALHVLSEYCLLYTSDAADE